jgi:SSS family solute:Na+ symporter
MVLLGVLFAGIAIPTHFFGSPAHAVHKLLQVHPGWLTLKQGSGEFGTVWFVSTVLLTSLGFYMWPDSMAAIYSAKSEDTLRRNAMYLPVYQLMLLLVYFAGFTALLVLPGLTGPSADQSFMLVVQKYYPPWVLGLMAGAGSLAGLIPASAQVLGAASIFTKNILGDWLGIAKSDRARTRATRIMVLVVSGLALLYWLLVKSTLVSLNLIAYEGVTQFFPGVVFALTWRRASAAGVMAGIFSGLAFLVLLTATHHENIGGINAGFFALLINIAICVVISLFSKTLRPIEVASENQ